MRRARVSNRRWELDRRQLNQSNQPPAYPLDEPDAWEPREGDHDGFLDWDDSDEELDPEPEPGDFSYEPDWDYDE